MRRPERVARLREEALERTLVFDPAALQRHGEGHVALLGPHVEVGEEAAQVGVVRLVVDDEPGVDRHATARDGQVAGIGVPARVVGCFVDDDFVVAAEQPGGPQAGDPGPDDGDFHERSALP